MAASPVVGSAGRAAGSGYTEPRLLPAIPTSDRNSFCLTCASWFFGEDRERCSKCGDTIFQWVHNRDLRFMERRFNAGGF